ncbi:MAG: galactokinase family protein [Eubacteriales bacterium]
MITPTAIILCAGRGTRMGDDRTNKVCYEIAGKPAVIRLIENLKEAGIERFIVVVGSKADKVMECLDGISGIVYAYQKIQNGTGNAALIGLNALYVMDKDVPAMICMGDKIIAPDVIMSLIASYNGCAVFAVQPKEWNSSGGRIVMRDGKVYGIVEQIDTCLQKISENLSLGEEGLRKLVESFELNEKKADKLLERAKSLTGGIVRTFRGQEFTADDIEQGVFVNTATYLVNQDLTRNALSTIDSKNAQGELYMTDAINHISETHSLKTITINDPKQMLTYSTMDELLKLEQYFSPEKQENDFSYASKLLNKLKAWSAETEEVFKCIYGSDWKLIEDRKDAYESLLVAFIEKYGDKKVVIVRAPGRVNLMGRHIEHRGGSINVMTISREMIVASSVREDDIVHMANTDPNFAESEFSILKYLREYDTENWVEYIDSDTITKLVNDNKGDWQNYVKAGVLRLQLSDKNHILHGMNMMFSGNIPMAAGLSSSSSIVVSTLEAAITLNNSSLEVSRFISLCGEGEWLVGSRGGAGDHAAMKCGTLGKITHLYFNPFSVGEAISLPDDFRLVVANSFIEAKKSAEGKDQFNAKIASYEFGFMQLKKKYPQYTEKLKVLKDFNPKNLSVPPSTIYEMLLSLPEHMSKEEIPEVLPEYKDRINQIFKTHRSPDRYDIRSVILYGIAECERSEYCIECLKKQDYNKLGIMMNISHNGDRVYKDGQKYDYSASDLYLYKLINDLKSEDPLRVERAQLYNQPGGYACSIREIDELIDYINAQEGVFGSQLSGAGLGGCVMALVKKENAPELLDKLREHYYDKIGKPMGAEEYTGIMGSGQLAL